MLTSNYGNTVLRRLFFCPTDRSIIRAFGQTFPPWQCAFPRRAEEPRRTEPVTVRVSAKILALIGAHHHHREHETAQPDAIPHWYAIGFRARGRCAILPYGIYTIGDGRACARAEERIFARPGKWYLPSPSRAGWNARNDRSIDDLNGAAVVSTTRTRASGGVDRALIEWQRINTSIAGITAVNRAALDADDLAFAYGVTWPTYGGNRHRRCNRNHRCSTRSTKIEREVNGHSRSAVNRLEIRLLYREHRKRFALLSKLITSSKLILIYRVSYIYRFIGYFIFNRSSIRLIAKRSGVSSPSSLSRLSSIWTAGQSGIATGNVTSFRSSLRSPSLRMHSERAGEDAHTWRYLSNHAWYIERWYPVVRRGVRNYVSALSN